MARSTWRETHVIADAANLERREHPSDRGIEGRARAQARTVLTDALLAVVVFALSGWILYLVNSPVIARLPTSGDEPWYLLQAYSILHYHTVDLTRVLHDPGVFRALLGSVPDDHTGDPTHSGVQVLPNLPGYAALIAPVYAWQGRPAILVLQAICAAFTIALLYSEARRLFHSRAVGLFASLAALLAVPSLFYVGQVFPSTIATMLTLLGLVAVSHWLAESSGWRLVGAEVAVGICVAVLPWLHFRYALTSVALLALAVYVLVSRRTAANAADDGRARRVASAGIIGLAVAFVLSFGAIALYCQQYLGTWTPQVNLAQPQQADLSHPDLGRVLWLFSDIFLSPQNGLLPWVPLFILAPFGLILLWRGARRSAVCIGVLFVAQMATPASALVSDVIYQGYAFPARFAIESVPLFVLGVAAVFAWCLTAAQSMRRWAAGVGRVEGTWRLARRPGVGSVAADRWRAALRCGLGLLCVLVLGFGAWTARVIAQDPYLWYASHSGPRLVEKYPSALPAWWFAVFPETPIFPYNYLTAATIAFPYTTSLDHDSRTEALTDWTDIPPGQYTAQFAYACGGGSGGTAIPSQPGIQVVIERQIGSYPQHTWPIRIAQGQVVAATCDGTHRATVSLHFVSDGYERTGFRIVSPNGVVLTKLTVSYARARPG